MSSATAALDAFINRVGGVATPFTIEMPDGAKRSVGQGEPVFSVTLHNDRAVKAVRTLDEAEVEASVTKILHALAKHLGGALRG